jgi:hypothetical protein
MPLDDVQKAWLQTHKQFAGAGSGSPSDGDDQASAGDATVSQPAQTGTTRNQNPAGNETSAQELAAFAGAPPPTLKYIVPAAEIAACSKYLDDHKLAAVLIAGKTGLSQPDYEFRLDDQPREFYNVVDILMRQIPEGGLPNGPIRSEALSQVSHLVEDRFQAALAKAMADRKAAPTPPAGTTPQPPADKTTDPAGKSTTLPIPPPPPTQLSDEEAEWLYEIDFDAVRTLGATAKGNVPPDPQFTLKLTKHVEIWAKKSGGAKPTWTFKLLGDPSVALQSGKDFKPTDQFSINVAHLIWDSHLLPATELSLQANGSAFLDKQIGAQVELEQPLLSEVSLIVDGTFDYGKGPNDGKTNYAITAGLEFKLFGWGKK